MSEQLRIYFGKLVTEKRRLLLLPLLFVMLLSNCSDKEKKTNVIKVEKGGFLFWDI
jgi:hypothetical protein